MKKLEIDTMAQDQELDLDAAIQRMKDYADRNRDSFSESLRMVPPAIEPFSIETIAENPTYKEFVDKYKDNLALFLSDFFDMKLTPHEKNMLDSFSQQSSKTMFKTEKPCQTYDATFSDLSLGVALSFMLTNPNSHVLFILPFGSVLPFSALELNVRKLFTSKLLTVIEKYDLDKKIPWLSYQFNRKIPGQFKHYCLRSWRIDVFNDSTPERFAGLYDTHSLYIVTPDINSRTMDIISCGMTGLDNRLLVINTYNG